MPSHGPVAQATAWSACRTTIRTDAAPAITIAGSGMGMVVGARRSRRARVMGVCWNDGHLAAKTLFAALRACGIDPEVQVYLNLYDERCVRLRPCQGVLRRLSRLSTGRTIVAMGRRVHGVLQRQQIPHLALVHPAARGLIRGRAVYQAHVRAVLEAHID